jgi:aldehyde:ferredoxin oxidoreductase
MSNTIGLAFHLYETGRITQSDTGGLELIWGNAQVVAPLIEQTVQRQGFGALLADGALRLGRHFGAEEEAVQVNGLEVAYHDPRGASGMALVYATSPRGACHNQSDYFMVDIWKPEPSIGVEYHHRHAAEEKSASVARHQDWRTICNSLVFCILANLEPELILPLINASCGLEWSLEEMMKAGERAWNLKRVINNRFGLNRSNDKLPKALLEPYKDVEIQDIAYRVDFMPMLEAYYQARGWDPKTGFPTIEKLIELDLEFSIPDIYPAYLFEESK